MDKKLSKIINAILAILSIIFFLTLDFYGWGSQKNITGSQILDAVDEDNLWPLLYIAIPIIQIFLRFAAKQMQNAIACGCIMFIPTITALVNCDPEHLQIGFYVYAVISFVMILLPCFESENMHHAGSNVIVSRINNEVKNYSNQQLQEIVDAPAMYNEVLLNACKNELEIRTNAESMMPEVESYSDEKINGILEDKAKYSALLVFCCEAVKAGRTRKFLEEQQAEQQRVAKEKEEKRKAFWAKWRFVIIGAAVTVIAIISFIYFTSNAHYYNSGVRSYYTNDNAEKAIKRLSKIEDTNYENYLDVKYVLHDIYVSVGDTANAIQMAKDIYAAVKECEIEDLKALYNPQTSEDAYKMCANTLMSGIYGMKDYITALNLFSITNDMISCGVCYYHMGDYVEAFQTLEEYDNWRANIYKGLMYADGNGCGKSTRKAHECFSEVSLEDFLNFDYQEDQPDWFRLDGDLWNIDIIREYLTYKGDLSLIHGKMEFRASTYGEGFEDAKECYSIAARLFPNNAGLTRRNNFITKLAEVPTNNMKRTGDYYWTYFGEYTNDYSYTNGTRPYGYGIYEEESKGWNKDRMKLAIGKFGKDGRSFTWSDESLYIFYDNDDKLYYVGYWEKGKFRYMSRY